MTEKLQKTDYSFSFRTPSLIAYTNIVAQHGPDSSEARMFVESQAAKGTEVYQTFLKKAELLNKLVRDGDIVFGSEERQI